MNTLLITILFLVNFLSVSNDSNADYEFLLRNSKKYNTISYDKIVHDSQIKLLQILKLISKNQNRMVLSIDQLIHLIDQEIITYKQSELIWLYLMSKSETPTELPREIIKTEIPSLEEQKTETRIINEETIEVPKPKTTNNLLTDDKKSFSFYQLMFLILIGYTISVFFILVIVVALYQRETFILLPHESSPPPYFDQIEVT